VKEKVREFIEHSEFDAAFLDDRDGLHCAQCGRKGDEVPVLMNNPEMPRVVCCICIANEVPRMLENLDSKTTGDESGN